MARKMIVTVDETVSDAAFLNNLWDEDVTPLFSDDDPTDETEMEDTRVDFDSIDWDSVAIDRWIHESRRLPMSVARRLLGKAARTMITTDGTDVILSTMAKGEPVSRSDARHALHSIEWSALGTNTRPLSALIDWSGVNVKN